MKNSLIFFGLMLWTSLAMGQHNVFGNIIDETGSPLPGATVIVKETGLGSSTDADGFFMLQTLKKGDYTLLVDYLGYQSREQAISVNGHTSVDIALTSAVFDLGSIEVLGTWATSQTPVSQTNLTQEDLDPMNQGQDVPYLLRMTPSVVVTSDAGTGIGYTGLRIRGSDPTRINVTINGIPLNDAESQGVFWVDLPDFAGSTDQVQIQRGVGTSTNGAGAFGATINLQSNGLRKKAYAELFNSYGSFNSHKHSLELGSGLINNHWTFDGRLSLIQSDGYIDRAAADLRSYYISGGWYGDKTILKAIAFSGKEVTYQSWYGTPQSVLNGKEADRRTHAGNNGYSEAQLDNLLNAGRTYNFYLYDNEVDDYKQDHYQLHLSHQFSSEWSLRSALHYTHGNGFFEQFKTDDNFGDYGLPNAIIGGDTIVSSDIIRRRWLDNDYYGATANVQYDNGPLKLTLGSAFHQYDGDHFGEITWAAFSSEINPGDRYYDNTGNKSDFNIFGKAEWQIKNRWNLYGDLQMRRVDYKVLGVDSDLQNVDFAHDFTFFNPKLGVRYQWQEQQSVFASFAIGNREPDRNDFVDAAEGFSPKAESLSDVELGYQFRGKKFGFEANAYLMSYKDQLVLTGALNDVGASLRTNVAKSYRAGIELQWNWEIAKSLNWMANLTLSQNKIKDFQEILYDYTNGFEVIQNDFTNTDIAFSPGIISSSQLAFRPLKNLELALLTKYVGDQFLDNTSNPNRKLEAFLVNDLRLSYQVRPARMKAINLSFTVNNLFNEQYSSNGYTYSYIFGDTITENFYYPQAGTWWMAGIDLKF